MQKMEHYYLSDNQTDIDVMLVGPNVFMCESSYCFQPVLAITILSVCLSVRPSVCYTGRSVKNGAS